MEQSKRRVNRIAFLLFALLCILFFSSAKIYGAAVTVDVSYTTPTCGSPVTFTITPNGGEGVGTTIRYEKPSGEVFENWPSYQYYIKSVYYTSLNDGRLHTEHDVSRNCIQYRASNN